MVRCKPIQKIKPIQIIALILALCSAQARAEDLFAYLKSHGSIVTGLAIVDDQKEKLIEFQVNDDFQISGPLRSAVRVGLFSITRAGEQAPQPGIPVSLEQVKSYSDGEVWVSLYRDVKPGFGLEVTGGWMFKMTSITGQVGDPLDGSKFALVGGLRFSRGDYRVSIAGGHYGPVSAGGKVASFVPSLILHANLPVKFIGDNVSFVPDLGFGAERAEPGDPDQRRKFTRTIRLALRSTF